MDDTNSPAGASAEGATPLSDLIGPDRHQTLERHETEREVGAASMTDGEPRAETPAAAAAEPQSRQPAPKAAQPPKSGAQPAPAADAGEEPPAQREPSPDDPNSPKWYRDHMKRVNRELAELRASRGPEPAPARPAPQGGDRPAPQQVRLPNPAEDPEGYHRAITGHYSNQLAQFRLESTLTRSEDRVRTRHGDETFEDVKAWLGTQSQDLEDFFTHQPDPWGAAYAHMQREVLAQEIGDDPAAYRQRLEQQIRDQILAEQAERLGGDTQHIPAQRTQMRSTPPPPASVARSTQARDDGGRFAGQTPLSGALKHGGTR